MARASSALRQAGGGASRASGACSGPAATPLALFQRRGRTGHGLHVEVPKQVLAKTKLCKFFGVGACARGAACSYAHGAAELRRQPDLSCTELCFEFVHTGKCSKRSTCRYAHCKAELRIPQALEEAWPAPPAARSLAPAAAVAVADPQLLQEISVMQQETARLKAELEELRLATFKQKAVCDEWSAAIFSRQTTAGSDGASELSLPRDGEAGLAPVCQTMAAVDAGLFVSTGTATTDGELEEPRELEPPVLTQVVTSRTFFTLVPAQTRSSRRTLSCPPLGR